MPDTGIAVYSMWVCTTPIVTMDSSRMAIQIDENNDRKFVFGCKMASFRKRVRPYISKMPTSMQTVTISDRVPTACNSQVLHDSGESRIIIELVLRCIAAKRTYVLF